MQEKTMEHENEREVLEKRPGIFIIGSPNVGKRTLLSRLLSCDVEDSSDLSSDMLVKGWTIDTKYYSADVAVWMAHLHDGFSFGSLPNSTQLAALVIVFDLSELSSLALLKKWVSHTDLRSFDILLCIGNKVDLVPGHPAHEEYRRRLQRHGDSFVRSDADFPEYGISETEGSSLLEIDEPSCDISRLCLEWCMEHNIEYVEACASDVDFDKCLSVNGDSQGVERLFGGLSAHMWPGMVLKSGNRIPAPILPERQESSEEESDYEGDYEILSRGSGDLWDGTDESWISAQDPGAPNNPDLSTMEATGLNTDSTVEPVASSVGATEPKTVSEVERAEPSTASEGKNGEKVGCVEDEAHHDNDPDNGVHLQLDDLEQLMSEIANMRSSSRLMPDFQRRDMAAKLAMKMAAMFGDSSGDEGAE